MLAASQNKLFPSFASVSKVSRPYDSPLEMTLFLCLVWWSLDLEQFPSKEDIRKIVKFSKSGSLEATHPLVLYMVREEIPEVNEGKVFSLTKLAVQLSFSLNVFSCVFLINFSDMGHFLHRIVQNCLRIFNYPKS